VFTSPVHLDVTPAIVQVADLHSPAMEESPTMRSRRDVDKGSGVSRVIESERLGQPVNYFSNVRQMMCGLRLYLR
jgi:hypothetical protein